MQEEIRLLNYLRSQRFILYTAIVSVLLLSPYSYYVFCDLSSYSSPYKEVLGILTAVSLSSSILIFLVHKNVRVSKMFARFEIMIALYYYITHIGWSWKLIPAIGFSLIQPWAVSKYTKQIDAEVKPEKKN